MRRSLKSGKCTILGLRLFKVMDVGTPESSLALLVMISKKYVSSNVLTVLTLDDLIAVK